MAREINRPLLIICEGVADENFFLKLIEQRSLPEFVVVPANGTGNLGKTLKGLRADAAGFAQLKAIIIAADSNTDPRKSFRNIVRVVRATSFRPPSKPLELSVGTPRVAIMLLPSHDMPGSLETLCFKALVGRKAWLVSCVDTFLSCGNLTALAWPPEKLAKARFGAAVAATFKSDPSKALSYAFKKSNVGRRKIPPMLTTKSTHFNPVARWLGDIATEAMR